MQAADPSVNITIRRLAHSFPQKSLIVRLESAADGASTFIPANEDANEFKDAHDAEEPRVIIIGAHQDSLNYKLPFYRAPGADDDGSGTVALLQILRTLVGKVSALVVYLRDYMHLLDLMPFTPLTLRNSYSPSGRSTD